MKHLVIALLTLAPLFAHAQDSYPRLLKTPQQSKLDAQVYNVTQNGKEIGLVYVDAADCAARLEKDAKLNRWSDAERNQEQAKIPLGGYLRAAWGRTSIGAATADNFTFLVEAPDGKELLRYKPQPTIPKLLGVFSGVAMYNDVVLVPLPAPLPDGARVFVIEASASKRYEFVIHP